MAGAVLQGGPGAPGTVTGTARVVLDPLHAPDLEPDDILMPDERLVDFKKWSDDSIAGIGTNLGIEGRLDAERGVNDFQHYFAEQLELRRRVPRADLLTNLLNARVDSGDPDVTDDRALDMPE